MYASKEGIISVGVAFAGGQRSWDCTCGCCVCVCGRGVFSLISQRRVLLLT